jgi:uncharacterized membrane protein
MSKTLNTDTKRSGKKEGFAFGRLNYILLLAGILTVALGYMLMTGGGTDDPNVFQPEELFSTQRITVAPIVIVLGFIIILVGIMKKPRPATTENNG